MNTDKTVNAATILERSVCLVLRCQQFGNTKATRGVSLAVSQDGGLVEVKANKREWRASKRLLDSKTLRPANSVIENAKAYMRTASTSMHDVFGPGTYLVPIGMFSDVEERLGDLVDVLRSTVDTLADGYEGYIELRKQSLGELFDSKDYPSAPDLRAAFSIDWSYVSFSAPEKLIDVDRAAYEVAQQKHAGRLSTAYDEVVLGLRTAALDVMRDLTKRLAPQEDGKMRALRSTALNELRVFSDNLLKMNITDDAELASAMATIQSLTEGVSVQSVNSSQELRTSLRDAASACTGVLSGLVESVTTCRGISFSDNLEQSRDS